MDSNNEPNQQQKSNQVLDAAKQQGQQAIQKMAKEGIKKGAAKASANAVGGSVTTGALAAILPYLLIALLIIICILIIIGFIAFVVTMPGMMQAKIDDIFTNMSTSIQSIYKGDVDASVTEKDVIELANYINGMEYDLIGYGFVQPDKDSSVKTIEQLREAGYSVNTEKNPDKKNDDDGEPEELIFLVDENGNKYNQKWYYTDGKKYGTNGKVANESDGSYKRYEITYDSLNKITKLPDATSNSSILRTYAMSERRLYVLRNNDQGFFETFATWLNEVLNGYSGAWAQGLLELFPAVNGRADEGRYNLWDSIKKVSKVKITGDNKLSIDVGWFNEPMKFELEGWSGRYGLSTDFLISLHLATLSPELVTTLVQNYDTRAQIYLDHITGATVTSYFHTEDMKDNEGNPEYVSLDKFKEYKKDNKWNLLDGWFLSKKEAKKIMKEIGIESLESGKYTCGGEDPSQVIYYSGEGSDRVNGDCFTQTFDDIDWYDNVFKDQYFLDKHSFSSWEDALNIQVINTDNGEKASNTKKDKHVIVEKSTTIVAEAASAAEEPNDDNEDLQDDSGNNGSYSVENISVTMSSNNKDFRTGKLKKVLGMLDVYYDAINTSTDLNIVEFKNEEDCPLNFCSIFNPESEHYFENYLSYSEFKSMPKDKDIYYECEVAVWKTNDDGLKEGDEGYDMAKDGEIVLSLLVRRTGADQNFDLAAIAYRNYSLEEMMENGMDPSKPSGHTLCSDSSSDAVCSTCRRYISDIISALGKIEDDSYETFEPYIARVVGSWFRDTYFIVPEKDDDATNIVYDEYGKKYYPKGSLTLGEVNVIQNDEEFLKETDELWTDYLYDDRNIDYALFVINPDGSYLNSDSDFEDWKNYYPDLPNEIYDSIGVLTKEGEDYYGYINVYPDSNPADIPLDTDIELLFKENDVPFIKRARVNKLTAGGTANSTGGWSAYSYSENWSDEKVAIDVIDAPGKIQKVHAAYNFKKDEPENIFYYSIKAKNVVAQMEDGQRGMTNEKIKYLFKNKKYYKYDGTTQTAFDIRDDWNEVLDIFSEAKPMKKENVKATLKETARTAVKIALFGWTNLFDNYDENIDSARETVMDGYIDKVYLREDLSATGFDNFKFARDFDDDGIADLASENLKNSSSYDNLEINESTKFSNDPRNPDLINNIDLTTESLAAFSILENTHTPDADYAYRDFKELICELDYFDKEDLTEPATDILEWILPESGSAGWPVRKYDKLNEFGSLIHSKSMYETLNSIMIQSVNGGVQSGQLPSGGPENSENQVSNASNTNLDETLLDINYDELYSVAQVSSRNTSTTYIEPVDEFMYDDYHDTGYKVIVKANGIQYKSYKQGENAYYAGYAIPPFTRNDPNDCMATDACGITSTAIVLSAYDIPEDPWDLAQEVETTYTYCFSDLAGIGKNHNVEFQPEVLVQNESDIASAADKLKEAFNEGKPAIILVGAGGGYTSEGHYMVAIGVDSDDHLIIINCGSPEYAGFEDTGLTIEEFFSINMVMANGNSAGRGFMVPVEAPKGFYSNNKIFEGFEKGQPVVTPATVKVLEIGTVEVNNENTSSIMQRFYKRDDDPNVQNGDSDNEELITVTEEQYNVIESTAQAFENDSDSTFGKTYETGYIKLEIIGKESLVNIQQNCKDSNLDVTYLEYFLDNYGFKDENNDGIDDDGKTICESYIIYIEGIELRYNQNGDWTFDNTIISEIMKTKSNATNTVPQTTTSGTVYRGDLLTEDVSNTITLFNAQIGSDQTYNIDNYTKREIPEYYPLGKRQDLSRMEDRKIAGTSIIETVNNEIYLKAGTLIGLTGDSNIKIIMKNREGAVVENVEDYLEIEDGKSQSGLTSDLMNFYFLPYESGGSKVGTYTHGTCSTGECAIGIIQWTTLSTADGANYSLSGVQNLCKFLYEADSSFCGILAPYANWTDSQVYNDIKSGSSEIGAAFKKLDDQNHEKLLSLEIQCAEDGFYSFIESKGTSWVLERTSGLIGSYYSLLAWAPNAGWESVFDQSKTDKQMLLDLMYKACQSDSTIGKLNHRWHSQCRLGVDMIEGTVSEEQVVEWIEENDKSEIYDRYKYGANGAASNHASYGPGDYIYDERGG